LLRRRGRLVVVGQLDEGQRQGDRGEDRDERQDQQRRAPRISVGCGSGSAFAASPSATCVVAGWGSEPGVHVVAAQ
jgi:hypothetical protein